MVLAEPRTTMAAVSVARLNPAARLLALLLGHEARINEEQWEDVRAMSNERLCACGHDWNDHKKPRNKISWDVCSFPCSTCDCPEYDSTNKMTTAPPQPPPPCPGCEAAARERDDLRARLAAEAAEWRTEARYDKTAADIFDTCADAVERIIAETEAK